MKTGINMGGGWSFRRILVMLIMLSCWGCGEDGADPGNNTAARTLLSLDYDTSVAKVGDSLKASVRLTDVSDLFGFGMDVVYDPSALKYLSSSKGSVLSAGERNTQYFSTLEDGAQGRLITGESRLGKVSGYSGSGVLFHLTFQVLSEDSLKQIITIEKIRLVNSRLRQITDIDCTSGSCVR